LPPCSSPPTDGHREAQREPQKTKIDQDIPNLFFGFPQPETPSAARPQARPSQKPKDTNYYVWMMRPIQFAHPTTSSRQALFTGHKIHYRYATA